MRYAIILFIISTMLFGCVRVPSYVAPAVLVGGGGQSSDPLWSVGQYSVTAGAWCLAIAGLAYVASITPYFTVIGSGIRPVIAECAILSVGAICVGYGMRYVAEHWWIVYCCFAFLLLLYAYRHQKIIKTLIDKVKTPVV